MVPLPASSSVSTQIEHFSDTIGGYGTLCPCREWAESRGTVVKRGYSDHKDDVQRRLKRIEGQIRGLQRMVEEDTYCIDVLTQVSAASKALQSVALELLGDHLSHCVHQAVVQGGTAAEDKVKEAQAAIERLVRS